MCQDYPRWRFFTRDFQKGISVNKEQNHHPISWTEIKSNIREHSEFKYRYPKWERCQKFSQRIKGMSVFSNINTFGITFQLVDRTSVNQDKIIRTLQREKKNKTKTENKVVPIKNCEIQSFLASHFERLKMTKWHCSNKKLLLVWN